jgi:hypothetical protein
MQFEPFEAEVRTVSGFDSNLLEECNSIYNQIKNKCDF